MADNVAITAGTGTTIAADDIGGVLHQRIKISQGADGSATDVSSAAPLQVTLANTGTNATAVKVDNSAVTQPISGTVTANIGTVATLATAAKQDTGNTSVASIDTKFPAQGQALAAASTPVVLTAAQITTLTPPAAITGFATVAKQPALGTAGTASSDVITVQGKAAMTPLLTDGSATTQPVSGTFYQATQPVSIATSPVLVAGTALIGKVGIDQATANANEVVTKTGSITTATLAAETTKVIGTVNQGTSPWVVTGGGGGTEYTEDAVSAANPVGNALIVVREDARAGALTTADGDNVALRGNNSGELYVKHTDSVAVTGTVTANAGTNLNTSTLALEAGGNLASVKTNTDKIPAQGQALAAASTPVVLTAAQVTTLTPPAAITNFANETGGNLATVKTNTDKIPSQGQALAASSTPVVLTAAQVTTLTPPAAITGFATSAKQDTIIGHVDGVETLLGTIDTKLAGTLTVTGGGGGTEYTEDVATANPIVGTATMIERDDVLSVVTPIEGDNIGLRGTAEGALWIQDFNSDAILADTTAILADTAAIQTAVELIDNAVSGAGFNTTQLGGVNVAMNTGTRSTGTQRVTIATDDLVPVTGTITAVTAITNALPTGANAIGKLAANSGVDIGDVDVTSINSFVAHDAAIAGNPLTIGGVASAAAPTSVSADQDSVRAWYLRNGATATVLTAAGALIGGDAANGIDVDVTRLPTLASVTTVGTVTTLTGTTTLTPGTGATNLGKAEDGAHTSGDVGVFALAVRNDTLADVSGATGDYIQISNDLKGRLMVGSAPRTLKLNQVTTITASAAETTIVTAVASTFLDLYGLIVTNTSATAVTVAIKDATAGTTRLNIAVPAGDTRGFMLPIDAAIKQSGSNANWTATTQSVTSVIITALTVSNV